MSSDVQFVDVILPDLPNFTHLALKSQWRDESKLVQVITPKYVKRAVCLLSNRMTDKLKFEIISGYFKLFY